jgi:hypothetical protein
LKLNLNQTRKKVLKIADTSEKVTTTVNAESATIVTYKENCPACNEKYEDPPTEYWIMCCKCKIWWHEVCSYYEDPHKGFVCDLYVHKNNGRFIHNSDVT